MTDLQTPHNHAAISSQLCLPAVSPHMTSPVNNHSWQRGTHGTLHSTAGLLAAETFWERGDHCFSCGTTSEPTRLKQIAPTLCSKASLNKIKGHGCERKICEEPGWSLCAVSMELK